MLEERPITPRSRNRIESEVCANASLIEIPSDCSRRGTLTLVSGVAVPESIRAAAVITFSTLPGSYGAEIAGLPRSFLSAANGSAAS